MTRTYPRISQQNSLFILVGYLGCASACNFLGRTATFMHYKAYPSQCINSMWQRHILAAKVPTTSGSHFNLSITIQATDLEDGTYCPGLLRLQKAA